MAPPPKGAGVWHGTELMALPGVELIADVSMIAPLGHLDHEGMP
jgi:hypothetical protein